MFDLFHWTYGDKFVHLVSYAVCFYFCDGAHVIRVTVSGRCRFMFDVFVCIVFFTGAYYIVCFIAVMVLIGFE